MVGLYNDIIYTCFTEDMNYYNLMLYYTVSSFHSCFTNIML